MGKIELSCLGNEREGAGSVWRGALGRRPGQGRKGTISSFEGRKVK